MIYFDIPTEAISQYTAVIFFKELIKYTQYLVHEVKFWGIFCQFIVSPMSYLMSIILWAIFCHIWAMTYWEPSHLFTFSNALFGSMKSWITTYRWSLLGYIYKEEPGMSLVCQFACLCLWACHYLPLWRYGLLPVYATSKPDVVKVLSLTHTHGQVELQESKG